MADPTMADVGFYYTGGGSNSTPSASIGGAISSSRIRFQTASALTTLTGITIDDGLGNSEGAGTLALTAGAIPTVTWTPYGGSTGAAVSLTADGTYFVQAANNGGGLCITVVAASLPTNNVSNTVTITTSANKFFADQTKAESDAGVTKYHCFAIKNLHATLPIVGIKQWITENTPGADSCSIYLDPLAASDGSTGPTAVANENTAPSASTFVTPDSSTHADVLSVGTLTAGQVRFFWVKQLTPAGVTTATASNTLKLGHYIRA